MKYLVIIFRYLLLVNLETFILQQKDSDHYQTLVTLISLTETTNDRMGEYPRDRLNSHAASGIVPLRNLRYKSVEEKYEGQD